MARKRDRGICPYCGREKNLTQEHVIPDTLFREADRDMAVVYICYQCNHGMSPAIRDLRNWIALHIGSSRHPDAEFHLRKIVDTNEATRVWLKRTLDEAEPIDFVTDEGIVVGTGLLFPFNKERARLALANIVRGLYFLEKGEPLPVDAPVSVIEIDVRAAGTFVRNLTRYDHEPPVSKGNAVVTWVPFLVIGGESAETTAWLIWFMGGVCFVGGTGSIAKSLERQWQMILESEDDRPRVNGRVQGKAPRLPDGTYWTPPRPWAEFE